MVVIIGIFFIGQISDDVIVKSYACSIGYTILAVLQTIITILKFYGIYISKISKVVINTDLPKKRVNTSGLFLYRNKVYPVNTPNNN